MTTALGYSRVERGKVTIPPEIRDALGLHDGDTVAFLRTRDGVFMGSREALAKRALEFMAQALAEDETVLEDLIESGREERGEILREKYGLDGG